MDRYLQRFKLAPVLDEEEVRHWLLPQSRVINTWVVEGAGGAITDLLSFYTLPSTILGHDTYNELTVSTRAGSPSQGQLYSSQLNAHLPACT
jgi:glycylpeptide N-tetradecanoyltransferase